MEDIQCMDPDYEYEILDNYGDIDISDIPTSPTNTITESDGENFGDFCIDDLTFDEKSFQLAQSYTISNKDNKIIEEEYNIDWLASELDTATETNSIWSESISDDIDEHSALDYEIRDKERIKDFNNKCVIIDSINGEIKKCDNPVFRSIEQLVGL
ncbi:13141_t:CDS:1 [Ambispora gerdemannii]|uniref:13141_t:CDS:1 n=1 Tax=Ambispora gerdemannii TaxID=144530 RepID=A0A9N9HJT6_9GLOM|nr:13141_t:CDS:1 [Ambispora gerdemannii]